MTTSTTTNRDLCERRLCPSCDAELTNADDEAQTCTQCGQRLTNKQEAKGMSETKAIVSNPATFFINGQDARSFTYEGGTTLFHWSPYASGLSTSMESNVMFFANDEDHARDVLRRLFEFWITCNTKYVKHKHNQNDRHGLAANAENEIKVLNRYLEDMNHMVISKVPTNQFYKVSWASNDGLDVYDK